MAPATPPAPEDPPPENPISHAAKRPRLGRKRIIADILLLVVTLGGIAAWICWPGCFSRFNYGRIDVGMSRDRVTELLGSPGEETTLIPGHPPYVEKPGAPPGWLGVVWGDTFVHWRDGDRDIYVGFTAGLVTSKFFYEVSL